MSNRRLVVTERDVLKITEGPIPQAPAGGAVLKIAYAGVCHSDLHMKRRDFHAGFIYPRVLGHEISGTIHSIGTEASKSRPDLKVGNNVCVFPWGMCQNCNSCRADRSFCYTMHYGAGGAGTYVYGVWRDGGFQNYVVIDLIKFLEKVPVNVPMDQAAILMCSGLTSFNAFTKIRESIQDALVTDGKALTAVIGVGGLALWGIQIIKAMFPTNVKVVAVDIADEKLQDAKECGADMVHKWGTKESAAEASSALIKACGRPDAIIDYVGLPSVTERAHLSLNLGGTLAVVGLVGTMMPEMTLNSVVRRNIAIKGVIVGTQPQGRELLKLVTDGKVKPPPIYHVTLDEVSETFNLMHEGKLRGRSVVKM